MPHAFIPTLPLNSSSFLTASHLHPRNPKFASKCCRPNPNLHPHLHPHPHPHLHPIHRNPQMASTPLKDPPPHSPQQTPSHPSRFLRPILLILSSLSFLTIYSQRAILSTLFSSLLTQATNLGPVRGAFLLAGLNFFTVLFCFPANMGLMIAAGAVLGALPAFLALFFSKLAAACVAFVLARGILYGRATKWLNAHPRLQRILGESGDGGGWKFVLLMRLSPFPGFLLNYLLSLTGVAFVEYFLATVVGIVPGISNLVLVGAMAKDVVGGGGSLGWMGAGIRALCIGSMVVVTVLGGRRAKRVFAEYDEEEAAAG